MPQNAFSYAVDTSSGVTLSVSNDRSQGVASMADGELELMIHRRVLCDDNKGVGEPHNESGLSGLGLIVRGMHRVSIDPAAGAGAARRGAVADLLYRPVANFAGLAPGTTPAAWIAAHAAQRTGLTAPLPRNVHLLTVHSWSPTQLLLRLSHSYEAGEDAALATPATVGLATLFSGINIESCVETTLTANQRLDAVPKIVYALDGGANVTMPVVGAPPQGPALQVTLLPMEIRTWLCVVTAWGM